MTITLQIILIVVSILTLVFMCLKIRKSQLNVEDTIFWVFFSLWLIICSVFPGIPDFFARICGVESTVNFLFLSIIFIILIKLFFMTIKITKLENKVKTLSQKIAIKSFEEKE